MRATLYKAAGFILLCCSFLVLPAAQACDVCGCGSSGYYFGITPQFNKNFAGVRYRQQWFESHPGDPLFGTQEVFRITEVWARWYASPRWQLMAFVPYMMNTQRGNGWQKDLNGIADITLIGNYLWLNEAKHNDFALSKHTLATGFGVKLPTGRYQFEEQDQRQVANPNFQTGTGSTDLMAMVQYTFRRKQWGLWTDLNLRLNTPNSEEYRFGNRVGGNLAGFYVWNVMGGALMPTVGLWAEWADKDRDGNWIVHQTGGTLANGLIGLDAFYGRFSVGAQIQTPLAQDMGEGLFRAGNRLMLNCTVMF